MAFFTSTPIFISMSGSVATGAADAPKDFGTVTVPLTGTRYIVWGYQFWSINATGFSASAGTYQFFTQTGGLGSQLLNQTIDVTALVGATSFQNQFTTSSTASGTFTSPNLTVRQMTVADASGIIGIKVGLMPLATP